MISKKHSTLKFLIKHWWRIVVLSLFALPPATIHNRIKFIAHQRNSFYARTQKKLPAIFAFFQNNEIVVVLPLSTKHLENWFEIYDWLSQNLTDMICYKRTSRRSHLKLKAPLWIEALKKRRPNIISLDSVLSFIRQEKEHFTLNQHHKPKFWDLCPRLFCPPRTVFSDRLLSLPSFFFLFRCDYASL